jgi:hypothetical protein
LLKAKKLVNYTTQTLKINLFTVKTDKKPRGEYMALRALSLP